IFKGNVHRTGHYLKRLFKPFPDKARSQNGMLIYYFLPGTFQKLPLQVSRKRELQLFNINSGSGAIYRMEEHALLHRRQRIDVFNVFFAIPRQLQPCHFPLSLPTCLITLLSSLSSSPAKAKSEGVSSPTPAVRQCSLRTRS